MEIKGTGIKTIPEFIKLRHSDLYNNWTNILPEKSKFIMTNPIFPTSWYPIVDSLIIPTMKLGELIGSEVEAARLLGEYSAEVSLSGVYKIFIRVSSPGFVLSRSSTVINSYYKGADIKIIEKTDESAVMEFVGITPDLLLIMHRISGWIYKTIEITGFNLISLNIEKGDNYNKIWPVIFVK